MGFVENGLLFRLLSTIRRGMNFFGRKGKKDRAVVGKTSKEKAPPQLLHGQLRVLGVPLAQAVRNNPSHDGVPVPAVVRECLDFISLYGLHVEGVFRVSSPKSRLDHLERLANDGRADEILFQDAHEAAGLLKRFLRQLPENILTAQLKNRFESEANVCRCVGLCRCSSAIRLKELLLQLPSENFHLLAFVFRNVQLVIQKETANKMSLPAMGVLLHAILEMPRNVVKIFITNAAAERNVEDGEDGQTTQLFDSVDIGPYLKPKSVVELQKNPPNEKKELENEIKKQQFVLEHLHGQVQQMREGRRLAAETTAKEETMLWEVQAAITMLKRRLKTLNEKSQKDDEEWTKGGDDHQSVASRGAKDGGTGTADTPPAQDEQQTTTTNFALLESQLLAVQTTLRDEITEEKRQIAHLLSVLRELNTKLPEDEQNKMNDSQRKKCDETQKSPLLSSSANASAPSTQRDSEENDKWEEWCKAEERRRDGLLGELIRYRKIYAQLRARLEHDTALINLMEEQKHTTDKGPTPAANLLVTRF